MRNCTFKETQNGARIKTVPVSIIDKVKYIYTSYKNMDLSSSIRATSKKNVDINILFNLSPYLLHKQCDLNISTLNKNMLIFFIYKNTIFLLNIDQKNIIISSLGSI